MTIVSSLSNALYSQAFRQRPVFLINLSIT